MIVVHMLTALVVFRFITCKIPFVSVEVCIRDMITMAVVAESATDASM